MEIRTRVVRLPVREAAAQRSHTTGHHAQDGLEQRPQKRQSAGSWHDNRHTLITELAESGAGDQTIMDIAGHVSKQMLKHYSHIRMEAKRKALESIVRKPRNPASAARCRMVDQCSADAQEIEGGSLQKSLQSGELRVIGE